VTLEGLDGITTIEDLECDSNPRLERLTGIPASPTFLSARWCGLIDISAASVLGPGATLYFGGNRTLQSAAGLPETPKVVNLASCNLTGTFTLSGGDCILDYNPGLTKVTQAEGDEAFKAEVLSAEFCDLTGNLDKQLSATELCLAGNPKLKGQLVAM
jgi:hypothetical protein